MSWNPFRGRQKGVSTASPQASQTAQTQQSNTQQAVPSTGTPAPGLQNIEGGNLNLVNYSPEQLMLHVENTMSGVHFGMSGPHRFMEAVAELWSVFGPIVLLLGTAGEVFAFIWNNT